MKSLLVWNAKCVKNKLFVQAGSFLVLTTVSRCLDRSAITGTYTRVFKNVLTIDPGNDLENVPRIDPGNVLENVPRIDPGNVLVNAPRIDSGNDQAFPAFSF